MEHIQTTHSDSEEVKENKPIKPNKIQVSINFVLGTLAGLIIGIPLFIYLFQETDNTFKPPVPNKEILSQIFQKEIDMVNENLKELYDEKSLPALIVSLKQIQPLEECEIELTRNDNKELESAIASCPVTATTYSQIAGENKETFTMILNMPRNENEFFQLASIRNKK